METFKSWTQKVVGERPDITADWNDSQIDIATDSNYGIELKTRISCSPNPIQKALMIKMLAMVEQMKEMQKIKQKVDNLSDKILYHFQKEAELDKKYDLKAVRNIGFTSASFNKKDEALQKKYIQERKRLIQEKLDCIDAYEMMKGRMELIVRMKEYWGDETLLVPFDDFEKICNKYNLTCGTFDEYTGNVPVDKIEKIAEIKRKLKNADRYWIDGIRGGIIKMLHRIIEANLWEYFDYNNTPHLRECVKRVDSVFPFTDSTEDAYGHNLILGESTYLFICAPKKYMKGVPKPIINYTDPFICAYTNYGIMILEKWDLEAEDEIIKNHQQKQSSFADGIRSFFQWLSK